jgi:hypothetical protein
MRDFDRSAAIALLDAASIDPIIVNEIIDDVIDGFEEDAARKLVDEMDISDEQASAILAHIRDDLGGKDMVLEEIPVDLVPFAPIADMPTSGNPFTPRVSYFVRRGMRVLAAYPYRDGRGVEGFSIGGVFRPSTDVSQIWRTSPTSRTEGETR